MILLLSNTRDLAADLLVLSCRRQGISFCRLNTDTWISSCSAYARIRPKNEEVLHVDGVRVSLDRISAIIYRRPLAPIPDSSLSAGLGDFSTRESEALLYTMLESLNVPWLNGRSSMRYAGNRLRHLKAAQDEGFSVPDTILTSDISAARQFAASHTAVVVKTIHSNVVVDDGQQRCIYTTKVDSAAFANVKEIRSSPMIVQRYIEKTVDIRVVVTGQAAFAIQIDSKDDPAVGCDWRAGSIRRQTHRRHELPISLERACIRLTHRLGLVFSAIDLCVSSNGEYIFFEVNPNGQWAWLETHVGIPIADSLVACARAGLKAWPPSLLS